MRNNRLKKRTFKPQPIKRDSSGLMSSIHTMAIKDSKLKRLRRSEYLERRWIPGQDSTTQ